ncbi:uncharacterized protein LOC123498029 isoform X2 [Portunus trituberculatus]|uniref:uncharacterized protein LOC123498029 isoform X2 n=1 Tax=Portunus trituberculatus TaxID=210409 RepID=UPI001E1CD2F2|nr:uncharacterized protein LOC123498029 isoform X2 [Portunus trituberculatus]
MAHNTERMETNALDSDPLTFEEEFEPCIHSQDEGTEGAEAAVTKKSGRKARKSVEHFTVQEFSEKYPGCFSMEYQVDVFKEVEHSTCTNKYSPTNMSAKKVLQPSPVSNFWAKYNKDFTRENGNLFQHIDLSYDSQKSLKKEKNSSQFYSPQIPLEGCEEHPGSEIEASLSKSASRASTKRNGAFGLRHKYSHSNTNEWTVSETERKENVFLTVSERNLSGSFKMSTVNSEAGRVTESNPTDTLSVCHKLCNKVFKKKVSPKRLFENYQQNRKDKFLKITGENIQYISHTSPSCDGRTGAPGQDLPKDTLSQNCEQTRRRSAPSFLDSVKCNLSATLYPSSLAASVDAVDTSLPYKSTDCNWQVTWNTKFQCGSKPNSEWQITDISKLEVLKEKTQPSRFGTLGKPAEARSWRKGPRRSLDWPPVRDTSCEASKEPSKYLDVTTLNWRTAPRKSSSGSFSRFFQDKVKADFDDKELVVKSFAPGFVDTHCHIDFLFERIRHSGSYSKFRNDTKDPFPLSYEGCVTIFCKPWTFSKISWWEAIIEEVGVWAAFGCHPHFADHFGDEEEAYLQVALMNSNTLALGEIGLDYHKKNQDRFTTQKDVFRRQLRVAVSVNKPVVIHCRDAQRDCIDIMKEILPLNYPIHLHCFCGTWREAEEWLETFSGLFLGITNLVNNTNDLRCHELQMAVKKIPLQRLLLETDAPYFRPAFLQAGQHSHPGMALYVAAKVAHLKGEEVEVVLAKTRNNTKLMYGI